MPNVVIYDFKRNQAEIPFISSAVDGMNALVVEFFSQKLVFFPKKQNFFLFIINAQGTQI
jgi:hypothetical protein